MELYSPVKEIISDMDLRLRNIASVFETLTGRSMNALEEGFLLQTVSKRLVKHHIDSWDDYAQVLIQDPVEAEALNQELTITTSFFFREPIMFTSLRSILQNLNEHKKSRNKALRIWCAGCAAGQEPYSIAILLEDIQEKMGIHIPYRIFATDLSQKALEAARKGVYAEQIVQNVSLYQLNRYFTKQDQGYQLTDKIINKVSFSKQDLLNQDGIIPIDSIYGHFDVILCCNLLIYYKPCVQGEIIDKMINHLSDSGVLILGESEHALLEGHTKLSQQILKTGIYQRK